MKLTYSQETLDASEILPQSSKKENKSIISYPSLPLRNSSLRSHDAIVDLTTNLMKLQISEHEQKLCLYSVSLLPELDRNNYSLFAIIQRQIDVDLSNIISLVVVFLVIIYSRQVPTLLIISKFRQE